MKKRIVLIMILASLAACSGGGGSGSPSGGAADIAAAHQLFDLDRVRVTDGEILDSSGRQVILRGLVTITLNVNLITGEVQRPDLTSTDYERMRAWGFNAQVIRLEGGRLGLNPDQPVDAAYLGLLASWTNLAAQQGIHTVFKMTTYDVPGWGWNNAFNPARWQAFWDNEGGQQDQFLAGWRNVWRYFAGWTAVIGYDILNEPHAGTRTTPFVSQYLKPFYNRASQALRQTDGEVALIFQPPVTGGELSLAPDDPHPFFAPHIYPSSLDQIGVWLGQYANNAALMNTPIAVMEYGLPDNEFSGMLTWTLESERLYAARFDE
jgi:hypothetical protein